MNINSRKSKWKSTDVDEFFDVYFYRPIGHQVAFFLRKMDASCHSTNMVALFIGVYGCLCFRYIDLKSNIGGIFLVVLSLILRSGNRQYTKETNQKTYMGYVVEGLSISVLFIAVYIVLTFRLWSEWSFWALPLVAAGAYMHIKQAAVENYFRAMHLHFLNNEPESDFEDATELAAEYATEYAQVSWNKQVLPKIFDYTHYLFRRDQEKNTPQMQKMRNIIQTKYNGQAPPKFREDYLAQSLRLIPWANALSFNVHFVVLFISALVFPAAYLIVELTLLNIILLYLWLKSEKMCNQFAAQLESGT
ncbi:hypothetical protein AGMMS49982_09530 [Bacteroidia bacterium]|nr:hypothetical protein AGMMS49982_09530 [Bacteroidia bacterium]